MRSTLLALAMLIGTTSARAAEITDPPDGGVLDVGTDPTGDADPGPRLPNGEPPPDPDLANDAGGCSCRTTSAALSAPAALMLVAALLLRRRR